MIQKRDEVCISIEMCNQTMLNQKLLNTSRPTRISGLAWPSNPREKCTAVSSHDNQPTPDDPMQGNASYMIQLGCALLLFSLSFSPPALEVDYPLPQLIITFLHCPTGLAAYIPYCSLSHY